MFNIFRNQINSAVMDTKSEKMDNIWMIDINQHLQFTLDQMNLITPNLEKLLNSNRSTKIISEINLGLC